MNNKYVNAMRSLALQAIMKAGQGHTGMAMSACPINYTLYTKFINIAKGQPKWINRDRFVLSAGHGSMSYYSLLHFGGFLSLKEIKNHKQQGSLTPGHPEYEPNNYVDCSTGPLGQGVAMAVGMALNESYLRTKYSKLGLINHYTYVVVGDGDLQEGISYEAMSLAGKLGLNKLIMVHDSNDCQLDAKVNEAFDENLKLRMESMNWEYIKSSNDPKDIAQAVNLAKKSKKPTFIEVKTIIGEGTSQEGSNKAHGLKVDQNEIKLFEQHFEEKVKNFKFDKSIYNHFENNIQKRGLKAYNKWVEKAKLAQSKYPKLYKEFINNINGKFVDVSKILDEKKIKQNSATRDYVGEYFKQLEKSGLKDTIFGSADLASATKTSFNVKNSFNSNKKYPEVLFGIREFAMAGIQNGILLHKGSRCLTSTFLSFADYMKSAIRLGALMKMPSSYIFTHDSYQVGGDGPTHQPYDQLPMLRAIQGVYVYRPCDEVETKFVFNQLFSNKDETRIGIFTRQGLKSGFKTSIDKAVNGAYVLASDTNPDITLVGCGSEIQLLMSVKDELNKQDIKVKVVSAISLQKFLEKDEKYISETLKSKSGIFTCEPSSDCMWYKLQKYGTKFAHLGATTFGESMDGDKLYKEKGFNVDNIVKIVKKEIL